MNITNQQSSTGSLSPKRLKEKAGILETNLFKSVSKQNNPSKMQVKINRDSYPDAVILRAIVQLTSRFNIKASEYLQELRELLQKDIPFDRQESVSKNLKDPGETFYDDLSIHTRTFKAVASTKELAIIIEGIPAIESEDGAIAKSFFNHEKSPGKMLKDGAINFKEINKYPIVNAGDKLFYISHEKQGKQGISYDCKPIPVEEAKPFELTIGQGVEKIDDPDETGKSKGYFLQAQNTGVVNIDRNEDNVVTSISISNEVEIKKLDYSTGNIGSQFTCPISLKAGVICNGFKVRANGKVEATIVDGGEIITNNEAVIMKTQSDTTVMALKNITISSATRSKIISEKGVTTINRELIDSQVSSPALVFEKSKGLMTSNRIETENLMLKGLLFSGENIVHFGNNLFVEKEDLLKSREDIIKERCDLADFENELREKLQSELKKLTKLAVSFPELVQYIKPLIVATKTMHYDTIYQEMERIEKINNTKVVAAVRKLFETLEKIPQSIRSCKNRESQISEDINGIHQRMASMKLSIEGYLKPAATIKIFCGMSSEKEKTEPDFMVACDGNDNKMVNVTASYSPQKGFEFVK